MRIFFNKKVIGGNKRKERMNWVDEIERDLKYIDVTKRKKMLDHNI